MTIKETLLKEFEAAINAVFGATANVEFEKGYDVDASCIRWIADKVITSLDLED